MRLIRHPLVERDIIGIAEHIVAATDGDLAAAGRRLDEIDSLIADILANPLSGNRLSGPLTGWIVRHGGRDQRITIVFRPNTETDTLFIALVAFGGQDWISQAQPRQGMDEL